MTGAEVALVAAAVGGLVGAAGAVGGVWLEQQLSGRARRARELAERRRELSDRIRAISEGAGAMGLIINNPPVPDPSWFAQHGALMSEIHDLRSFAMGLPEDPQANVDGRARDLYIGWAAVSLIRQSRLLRESEVRPLARLMDDLYVAAGRKVDADRPGRSRAILWYSTMGMEAGPPPANWEPPPDAPNLSMDLSTQPDTTAPTETQQTKEGAGDRPT